MSAYRNFVPVLRSIGVMILALPFLVGCDTTLERERAEELVRLQYKQWNADPVSGKWFVEKVTIGDVLKVQGDTFHVTGSVSGYYSAPGEMNGTFSMSLAFSDTFQFTAFPAGTVWMAKSWQSFQQSVRERRFDPAALQTKD